MICGYVTFKNREIRIIMNDLEKLRKKALRLADSPGVYIMKDIKNKVIYVGKAKVLKNRVVSYFRDISSQNEKVRKMVENVADFEFEALVLEGKYKIWIF